MTCWFNQLSNEDQGDIKEYKGIHFKSGTKKTFSKVLRNYNSPFDEGFIFPFTDIYKL